MTKKEKAGIKIAYGAYRCVSGALLASGHGIMAKVITKPSDQVPLGGHMMKAGQETLKKGLAEWKESSK